MMPPTASARTRLDEYLKVLSNLGDGLSVDDFRDEAIERSKRTSQRVRLYIVTASILFMVLALGILASQMFVPTPALSIAMMSAAAWAFSLGGLGAVASIFLHVLKLVPQATLNASDEFEVFGRIILGCLFSTILTITIGSKVYLFFLWLEQLKYDAATERSDSSDPHYALLALLPFLLGYSIPLVLRLLEKMIQAVELTLGAEDRRIPAAVIRGQGKSVRRTTRKPTP